jgi:lysophospholipase L1-like esterase
VTLVRDVDGRGEQGEMTDVRQILVYGDSLTWGIIPNTRNRLLFSERWPGVMEQHLMRAGHAVRVIEDCLNGRRTVWDDPYKPGRNGLVGLEQRVEINSPLALVVVMLGTNDFQFVHQNNAWHAAQGIAALVRAIRRAPIEPTMPMPQVLIIAPPAIRNPRGPIAEKFRGAEEKSVGLAAAYLQIASELDCHFFDCATVTPSSLVDGVHLDAPQHLVLGEALAKRVGELLSRRGGKPGASDRRS